ncbi:MAG: hypothetical protein O2894_14265, partial [Planctomycetota bacterium]|nr:hypothetical protein [Planctomycetota bacterium]
MTPGSGAPKAPGRASKRKTPITPSPETSWELWWHLHREAFLPARRFAHAAITPHAGASGADGWQAERAVLARTRATPFLLALLEPGARVPDDVVASACLALGKIAEDAAVIDALFRLVLDPARADLVRESAALALGLLRRDDEALRLPTARIEATRGRLLQVFDKHVDGQRVDVPLRTRCFAMYAIGLLGDQPFLADPLSRDGRLIVKLIWERVGVEYGERDLTIALLTALGRQPRAGVPDGVIDGLREVIAGRKTLGHSFDHLERAHAVTALARLADPSGHAALLRLVGDARALLPLRLAAMLALTDRAPLLEGVERTAALRVIRQSFDADQELLASGLAHVALGSFVGADLATGSERTLSFDGADRLLLDRLAEAPEYLRGWAALGLALAARGAKAAGERGGPFRAR